MDGVKWLFFDIGSTLVDETKVYGDLFQKIADAAGVSAESVITRAIGFYRQNKRGHREVMQLLGVEYPEWSPEYEELYPDTVQCLQVLGEKYHLELSPTRSPGRSKGWKPWGSAVFLMCLSHRRKRALRNRIPEYSSSPWSGPAALRNRPS